LDAKQSKLNIKNIRILERINIGCSSISCIDDAKFHWIRSYWLSVEPIYADDTFSGEVGIEYGGYAEITGKREWTPLFEGKMVVAGVIIV
jgi:hypothetical protein